MLTGKNLISKSFEELHYFNIITAMKVLILIAFLQQEDPFKIDLEKMPMATRFKLEPCIKTPTVEGMIETPPLDTTKELHDFFLDELSFSVSCIRALNPDKKIKYKVHRESDYKKKGKSDIFYLDDEEGIFAKIETIEKTAERRIFYIHGYINIGIATVWARAVVITTSQMKEKMLEIKSKAYLYAEGLGGVAASILKDKAEKLLKKKTTLFVEAAREIAVSAKKDPKKFYEQIKKTNSVDKSGLEQFKTRFITKDDKQPPLW